MNAGQIINVFDRCFGDRYLIRLCGGAEEPLYLPAVGEQPARLFSVPTMPRLRCMKQRIGVWLVRSGAGWWILAMSIYHRHATKQSRGYFIKRNYAPNLWSIA